MIIFENTCLNTRSEFKRRAQCSFLVTKRLYLFFIPFTSGYLFGYFFFFVFFFFKILITSLFPLIDCEIVF